MGTDPRHIPSDGISRVHLGKMPVPAHHVGNKVILVGDLESSLEKQGSSVIYARVSSSEQKSDLDRQVAGVLGWAIEVVCS